MSVSSHSQTAEPGAIKRRTVAPGRAMKVMNPGVNNWESFIGLWERANLIRSFVWSQESPDETALFTQVLARIRRFFKIDFCFIAVHQEGGKVAQAGVPEALLDQLPVDFVRRSFELIANSRIPVCWTRLHAKTGFHTVVVSPLSPSVGQPLGFLMFGHSRARHFTNAELFLIQSLAGEVSWAIRELRSKQTHGKLLSAASLELKNSLNAVLRECAFLQESESSSSIAKDGKNLSNIEKNTREALRTIGSFLDTTIDQQGRLSVLHEPIDLVAVVDDTLNVCRQRAQKAGWRLETQYAEDLPRAYATDPARFRHVLRDLVDYATGIAAGGPLLIRVRKNCDFIEFNVNVSGPRYAGNTEPGAEPDFCSQHPGDPVSERLGPIRENLKLLNGHLHFLKLPDAGFEIGLCLP
jgi:signal transduction histidine kinase